MNPGVFLLVISVLYVCYAVALSLASTTEWAKDWPFAWMFFCYGIANAGIIMKHFGWVPQ